MKTGTDIIAEINRITGSELTFGILWNSIADECRVQEFIEDCKIDVMEQLEVDENDYDNNPELASKINDRSVECAMETVAKTIRRLPRMLKELSVTKKVYRAMHIADIDINSFVKQIRNTGKTEKGCIGLSWAFDEEHAKVYYSSYRGTSKKFKEYILTAKIVDIGAINVLGTLERYVIFGQEMEKENEVLLGDMEEVFLVDVKEKLSPTQTQCERMVYPINRNVCV
jgi:hypothetical protein